MEQRDCHNGPRSLIRTKAREGQPLGMQKTFGWFTAVLCCGVVSCHTGTVSATRQGRTSTPSTSLSASGVTSPGARVLLDAHNAYPERGAWADRIEIALGTGLPVAIEQDLFWYRPEGGEATSVVAHDDDALEGAPTLQAYFFERIRPLMERALLENKRDQWPLVVLNLDFKDNIPAHLDYFWRLLGNYESWLTTAPRTINAAHLEALSPGPLLVLAGSDTAQRRRFYDEVAPGGKLRAFGAMRPVPVAGATRSIRATRAMRMTAADHIDKRADNYTRWVNFPWNVVELGGQNYADGWTPADSIRLATLVRRAHESGFLIRLYTLDGFSAANDRGYTASYNFGDVDKARARWRAALKAGVDFVATDQYEQFGAEKREMLNKRIP